MEETEIDTESLQEKIHHEAHEGGPHSSWLSRVALSSAILAALAAVTALLSGHHANEAVIKQIRASDQWSYYQAKSIKSLVLQNVGKDSDEKTAKLEKYKTELETLSEEARTLEHESRHDLHAHEIYARGVTFFQVAISIGAIAALSRRKRLWWVSMGFGVLGAFFLIQGLLA